MSQIDTDELMTAALAMRQANPSMSARSVLDAVMLEPPGNVLKLRPAPPHETGWLGPRSAWGHLLREAFAPEVEPDYLLLFDDPDEEVRSVMEELWQRTVVKRFARCYLSGAA